MKEYRNFRLLIAALLLLFIQNAYLIVKLNETSEDAKYARSYASDAEDYAEKALRYARYAADYAEEAADHAEEAAENAFANVCSYCP